MRAISLADPRRAAATAPLVAVSGRGRGYITTVHAAREGRYDGPTHTLCGRPCYDWGGWRPDEDRPLAEAVTCRACRRKLAAL
jgi:hypothetical protein